MSDSTLKEAAARPKRAIAFVLAAIHIGALAALLPQCFSWSGVAVAVVLSYLTGGIGICLCYHRLLTHRSFALPRPIEYVFATIGALALQGDPIEWVATHRAHHAHSDTPRDPHDANRGFWWSHVRWLYAQNPARLTRAEVRHYAPDLCGDAYYRFLVRATPFLPIALAIALFAVGGISWLVWGMFVRLVFVYNVTWLVNSVNHAFGRHPYESRDLSTNNALVALLAFGEGWHNNHHAFPSSARHGLEASEVDVTWLMIRGLEIVRIARDVRVPTAAMLLRAPRARTAKQPRAI